MDKIGKYDILEVIGRGGMGTVYRARDTVIGRDVAIKVIAEHVASHANVKERLYQEATSAGRLSHEHIMTIFDVGETDGRPYLVMELLDGIDLRSASDGGKRLSFDRKLEIALQISRALAYAHARGVVHRDIKPENIRILPSGRVKILDFGIARVESETRTMTHSSIGTPRYMSPEQVKGQEIDHRTDIFSFGVVLYELLSGINPFDGNHVTAVIYKILHEKPEPLKIDDELLSSDVQRIVARCLEKEVENRYPDFDEVIRDLNSVLAKRRDEAPTIFDQRRFEEEASHADPRSPGATISIENERSGIVGPFSGTSANRARDSAATQRDKPESASTTKKRTWIVPAAAALVAALSIGGYFILRAGSGTDPSPRSAVSAAGGASADEELAGLLEDVMRIRDEMLSEKQSAEPFREADGLAGLYEDGLEQERRAVEALEGKTAASYRRAMDAFGIAKNTFRAVAIAGQNDDESVRAQAQSSQQAMERARRNVYAERGSPVIADLFARAEAAAARGVDQLEAGDNTAALASFGQAQTGFEDARRAIDRAAAAEELRRQVETARSAMETRRRRVAPWSDHPSNSAAFENAEELRREAIRLEDEGRHDDAASRFRQAEASYAAIREPEPEAEAQPEETTPSITASDADEAQAQMSQRKTSVPQALRPHERFAEAASIEQRAQDAYADANFQAAVDLFRQAEEAYAAVAALPPPKTAEQEVVEAILPLFSRFEESLQSKDADGLRQLHRFLGAYSAMFDVAEDIQADVDHSDISVSNGRATVSVSLQMSYKNRTQRMRAENQNVRLVWTMEDEGNGRWRLQDVTHE